MMHIYQHPVERKRKKVTYIYTMETQLLHYVLWCENIENYFDEDNDVIASFVYNSF